MVILGFCLFVFLLIKSQSMDSNQHNLYISDLRQINELDARLDEDILQARYGLLTHYDSIVDELNELKNSQKRLKKYLVLLINESREKLINAYKLI